MYLSNSWAISRPPTLGDFSLADTACHLRKWYDSLSVLSLTLWSWVVFHARAREDALYCELHTLIYPGLGHTKCWIGMMNFLICLVLHDSNIAFYRLLAILPRCHSSTNHMPATCAKSPTYLEAWVSYPRVPTGLHCSAVWGPFCSLRRGIFARRRNGKTVFFTQ